MEKRLKETFSLLTSLVKKSGPPAVALSGGVDSGLVALAAFRMHGPAALAVTVASELTPAGDEERAAALAGFIGIRHETLRLRLLEIEGVSSNPEDRCYHCKDAVFREIIGRAAAYGIKVVMDGTNADDAISYRPGLRSLRELGVVSPLAELGLGKKDIRELARWLGLPNWDAPSAPCLATRFPYGERLEPWRIARAGEAEEFIASLGFSVFRVRDHSGLARIELEPEEMARALSDEIIQKIVAKLTALGYNHVTLDLEGFRSGSMDAGLEDPKAGTRSTHPRKGQVKKLSND